MTENTLETGAISPRHEVQLKFAGTGFDMFGWFVVYILAYIPVGIPVAWWHRSYLKWLTRKVNVADASQLSFMGEPKAIWYLFPIYWLLQTAQGQIHDAGARSPVNSLAILFGCYLSWRVFKWIAQGIRLREQIQFRFTGKLLHFVGWEILVTLSYLTVIGWAWVVMAFFRWVCRHVESDHAEVRLVGKPVELLGIGLVCFVLPVVTILIAASLPSDQTCATLFSWFTGFNLRPDLSWIHGWVIALMVFWGLVTPRMLTWLLRWFIGNTRLIVTDAPPAVIENPVA